MVCFGVRTRLLARLGEWWNGCQFVMIRRMSDLDRVNNLTFGFKLHTGVCKQIDLDAAIMSFSVL